MNINVYTDGSCSGNPGVGGYTAILQCNGAERIVQGFVTSMTTNNAMELTAVVEAIKWINKIQKKPCAVTVYTDSKYIIDCACTKQKDGSKRKISWFKGRKNESLWMELIQQTISGKHEIRFVKVKGHSDNCVNNRADILAKAQCTRAKHELIRKKV